MPRPLSVATALALAAAACTSPPEHFTRVWMEGTTGEPFIGTSTEDGVLLLAQPEWQLGDILEIQFPFGNSLVIDKGRIDRLNDTLAIVRPLTARLREGRFAASLPLPGEELFVALRDDQDDPVAQGTQVWHEGAYGDWIVVPGRDADQLARDYAGTAVYVNRDDRWEIVGLLAGLTAQDENELVGVTAVGFLGLPEMARILPDRLDYFARDLRPLRPDFEFGVPLQPGDIVIGEAIAEDVEKHTEPVMPVFVPLPTVPKPAAAPGTKPKGGKGPAPGAKPKGKTQAKPKPKPGAPAPR
jgi:hypothetical protein